MELDQARTLLKDVVLCTMRGGGTTGIAALAMQLGHAPQVLSEMWSALESVGVVHRCTGGYTIDAQYVSDALDTLVAEGRLVSFVSGGKTHYHAVDG